MTTKARAMRCTTHHLCDCTQYHLDQMAGALRIIRTWARVPGALDAKHVLELIDKRLPEPRTQPGGQGEANADQA